MILKGSKLHQGHLPVLHSELCCPGMPIGIPRQDRLKDQSVAGPPRV
jgi:hypothetical protein